MILGRANGCDAQFSRRKLLGNVSGTGRRTDEELMWMCPRESGVRGH